MSWARHGIGHACIHDRWRIIMALWEAIGGIYGALHCSEFVILV
jgi:hypothetical protein